MWSVVSVSSSSTKAFSHVTSNWTLSASFRQTSGARASQLKCVYARTSAS